jgi:hypothetical protein
MSFAITAIAAGAGYALAGSTGALLGAGVGASIAGSQAASRAGSQQAAAAEQAAGVQSEASVRAAEIQAEAATRAAEIQAQSAREAGAIQERIAQEQIAQARRTFGEQREFLQPFQSAGLNALSRIQAGIAPGGEFIRPFTMDQFQADPGYAFRLSEGQKALERQAAARGGLISGPALKAATRFGQDMGSQEFQNAFARAQIERANALNPLLAMYGTGAETAAALSGAAGGAGSSIGSLSWSIRPSSGRCVNRRGSSRRRRHYRRGGRGRSRRVRCRSSRCSRAVRCSAGTNVRLSRGRKHFDGRFRPNVQPLSTTTAS